jgi:sialate O-acetylesterase
MFKNNTTQRVCIVALCVFVMTWLGPLAWAKVKLPAVLTSNIVVQRNLPVHFWGWANPGERIAVNFRGKIVKATTNRYGEWSVYLPPSPAGRPFNVLIQGKNRIILHDVLVGDVWVASGQSNMEFTMTHQGGYRGVVNAISEIAAADYPKLRLFKVKHTASLYPLENVQSDGWTKCTPSAVRYFSAVGYFFGRDIYRQEKVPVGIIEDAWGGSPAEAWTSLDALSANASLVPTLTAFSRLANGQATYLERRKILESQRRAGKHPKPLMWRPDLVSWAPGFLFNGMIAPLTRFPIRGVVWYQGESNTGAVRAPLYGRLFRTLISDWRSKWGEGDFPFLYVQLPNLKRRGVFWPTVREAQLQTLALRDTGMAVTIDIGDPNNIHPMDKQDVGYRLSLWARDLAYGDHVEDSGPLFLRAVPEGRSMRVWFSHVGMGLTVKGEQLKGFEVAGVGGKYVRAAAKLDGDSVIVASPHVRRPAYVRYARAQNPSATLYNLNGLPASPFTSQN